MKEDTYLLERISKFEKIGKKQVTEKRGTFE